MRLDQVDQDNSEAVIELNRLIEIGKLLASVLTEEEIAALHMLVIGSGAEYPRQLINSSLIELGNTSVA
jgi:hypothetical protein